MHQNGLFIFRRDLRIEDKIYIYINVQFIQTKS